MTKVAKLVFASFAVRIICDEHASDAQILDLATPLFVNKVKCELNENIEDIIDDTECLYGTLKGDAA